MKKFFSTFILIFLISVILRADPSDVANLPKLLGATNEGTEFYITFHPCWQTAAKQNFVRIYVSSRYATKVHVTAKGYDVEQTAIPNGTIQFILTASQAQAYETPGQAAIKPMPAQVWKNIAVHITAEEPVICYGVTRFQYVSDGFLALPVSVWGKEYTVASYADPTDNTDQRLPSFTSIVAAYDATRVNFTVGGNESMAIPLEDGITEAKAGERVTRILNKGDVWLIPGIHSYSDVSGSKVTADKPVGVISGNYCAYVPTEVAACDYISEMELPTYSWGQKYYIPTIHGRLKHSIIKIFPKFDTTALYKNDQHFGTIETVNGLRGSGWIERRGDEGLPHPISISSDKPINVVLYNPGQQDDNVESDPFQMNILPVEQYYDYMVFNTPGVKSGYGFKDNYMALMYQATKSWMMPDDLMFASTDSITHEFVWKKFKDIDSVSGLQIETDSLGINWMQKTYRLNGDGVYAIKANSKFGAYIYGFDSYDSYGYPIGSVLLDHSITDTIPPTCKFSTSKDSSIIATIQDRSNDDTTTIAGLSIIYMINAESYNANLVVNTFQTGDETAKCDLDILNKENDAKITFVATDRNGNDTIFVYSYKAPPTNAILESKDVKFGAVKLNSKISPLSFKIIDPSTTTTTNPIDTLLLKNNSRYFSLDTTTAIKGKTIDPNENIEVNINFSPDSLGIFKDSIGITSHGITKYYIEVSAEVAKPQIQLTGNPSFGEIPENESSILKYFSIQNTGLVDLSVTGITAPTTSSFIVEQTTYSESSPLVLTPGTEKKLWVKFVPTSVGDITDSVKVISDGEGNNTMILHGTGTVNDVEAMSVGTGGIILKQTPADISFKSDVEYIIDRLEIISTDCKIVSAQSPNKNINFVTCSTLQLEPGAYFVRIKADKETYSLRFMIVR